MAAQKTIPLLLTRQQVAAALHLSVDTIDRWREDGLGFRYVTLGDGVKPRIRYYAQDVADYIEQRTVVPAVRAAMEDRYVR